MARRAWQVSAVLLGGALAWAWFALTIDVGAEPALAAGGRDPFGPWPFVGYGAVVAGWLVLLPRLHRRPAA